MRQLIPFACVVLAASVAPYAQQRDARLQALRKEIIRLEQELSGLQQREGGALDELERLSAELSLGRARLRETGLREESVAEQVATHERRIATISEDQERRRRYLHFRLREMYKGGETQTLRRLLGSEYVEGYREGLRYAAFLSARDRSVLAGYREAQQRLVEEREALVEENERLNETRREIASANRALERGRQRQNRLLEEIRGDTARREAAIAELRSAADDLSGLIEGLDAAPDATALDMTKFQGLLDWPAEGRVRSGFGTVVHPRFKTKIPHPGWDIQAEAGDPIRAVFEGEVVFSGWMRGYGLMAVVDHGHGLHSVYAHAAVLLVEPGEPIERGARLGIVGETGSFSGPSLYFELRLDGRAVDPKSWLREK